MEIGKMNKQQMGFIEELEINYNMTIAELCAYYEQMKKLEIKPPENTCETSDGDILVY